jgi:hypothetical protein
VDLYFISYQCWAELTFFFIVGKRPYVHLEETRLVEMCGRHAGGKPTTGDVFKPRSTCVIHAGHGDFAQKRNVGRGDRCVLSPSLFFQPRLIDK